MTFLMITLLITFSTIWVGPHLAKGITIPIEQLAEGTRRVAHGNLDGIIHATSHDELGLLVASFNQMTRALRHSKMAIEQINADLRTSSSTVGALTWKPCSRILLSADIFRQSWTSDNCKPAAADLLEISAAGCLGQSYRQVFEASNLRPFLALIRIMQITKANSHQEQMQVAIKGKVHTLLVSLAFLKDGAHNSVHAMQGRGTIYIRTCCNLAQQRVQVEIRDTGPGIPDQFRGENL